MEPLILTARLDTDAQVYFNELRRLHFPPARNLLSAHLTLFHALPGLKLEELDLQLNQIAEEQPPIHGQAVGLRSLGSGVAFVIESQQLAIIRSKLADAWQELLTPQDRQTWRPHITIQNRTSPHIARELISQLQSGFEAKHFSFIGLDLWHYQGGPWAPARNYDFQLL